MSSSSSAIYNLSQLMRALWGVGTPKQAAARAKVLVEILLCLLTAGWSRFVSETMDWITEFNWQWEQSRPPVAGWVKNEVAAFF
jgi:hypothetical protein